MERRIKAVSTVSSVDVGAATRKGRKEEGMEKVVSDKKVWFISSIGN